MQFTLNQRHRTDDPNKKTEIQIECYFNRKYKYVNTGIFIVPQYWDKEKKVVSNKHPQSSTINNLLKTKVRELETLAYKYEEAGKVFDFNALKSVSNGKDKQNFCDFITEQLKNEPNLELKTIVKYKSNIEIIRKVLPDVTADKLDDSHILKLDNYFRDTYAQSTVARLHVFVQKYVKEAIKNRILKDNPYDLVKLNMFRGEAKTTMHTMAELEALENLKDLPKKHEMIRDRYLYSCYTGLRVSDNLALLKTAFTDTPEGYVVDLHTIKGYGHDLVHPIGLMFDGKPDKIARRWMNSHEEKTLFPKVSTTYISEVLKILAELAKINKHLTFHVARHTCASLLADISQNPYLIMNILGHSDIKTSMAYIHASPESTKKQLRLISNWKEKAR
ncbi:MAG: tyrosine-type recombinase/integrase [Paludibacter sp.]